MSVRSAMSRPYTTCVISERRTDEPRQFEHLTRFVPGSRDRLVARWIQTQDPGGRSNEQRAAKGRRMRRVVERNLSQSQSLFGAQIHCTESIAQLSPPQIAADASALWLAPSAIASF